MKRLTLLVLTGALLASTAFAGDTIVPPNEKYKINTTDIWWLYNHPLKKCEETTFKERTNFINAVRSENAIITEKYINDAGVTYVVNYEHKGEEYKIGLMNTYGECRLYQDIMIKGLGVKAKDYINMKPGK